MEAIRHYIARCFIFLLLSNVTFAQDPSDSLQRFDSTAAKFTIGAITLLGNKITKDNIIYRELTFRKGDLIDTARIESMIKRSEENLYNTSLFNSVHISWLQENDRIDIFIIVAERWYVFPLPIFEVAERNFNVWWQTKDFSRIIYGAILNWNNFRGRNEVIAFSARLGYTQRISFYYSIPYINKQQRSGLTFGFTYSRNHQSSISTEQNDVVYYKDETLFSKKEVSGSIAYSYRSDLYRTHIVELGYKHSEVLDTVVKLNNDYFTPGDSEINFTVLRYFSKAITAT